MPSPAFRLLTRTLLDEGIAPKFARRVRTELRDHYRDLEREALRCGKDPAEARLEAYRRIGSQQAIVRAFVERPELRSWIYRSRTLLLFLRIFCGTYLLIVRVRQSAATATLARFGIATAAAGIVTAVILLAMELSLRAWPSPRTNVDNQVTATHVEVALLDEVGHSARMEGSRAAPQTGTQVSSRRQLPEPRPRPDLPPLEQPLPTIEGPPIDYANPEPAIAAASFNLADSDYQPIVKVSPIFPAAAAARGIEGYVIVEYTVTRSGTVRDLVVVESSSSLFERSALEAAAKFKYKPRVVDGENVPVRGVRTIIRYQLERRAFVRDARVQTVAFVGPKSARQKLSRTPPKSVAPATLKPRASSYSSSSAFSIRPKTSTVAVTA